MARVLHQPPSIRVAAGTIVSTTVVVVVGSGVLMRLLDPHDYSTIGDGMWWALQTVTTVGYGDVTPTTRLGRIVAALVMLEGIAFLAVVTAAITSTFVGRATAEREAAHEKEQTSDVERLEARLDALDRKLDGLAQLIRGSSDV